MDHPVTPDRPPNDDGRVVPFRRPGPSRWPAASPHNGPVRDFGKYEHADSDDDYRHRMAMNVLALVATILLVIAGVWLVEQIAEMRKNQDCYLSGRRNCAPIEAPPTERG